MSALVCRGNDVVELYYYGELSPEERAEAAAHFERCAACRESLAALEAIGHALAARRVDAPPDGDWSGFMSRLDARIGPAPARRAMSWMQLAAAVALLATGALAGWTWSRATAPVERAAGPTPADAAIAERGGSELERARLVLAGLAAKSDGDTWALERDMAARLLPEVTLIRQAASLRGRDDLGDIEDVLRDVETLLLQASYAEPDDADTLARLRRMIERRDLLMRLSVASSKKPRTL